MPEKVLLADDDENFALLFRLAFETVRGASLEVVEDGAAAIRYLSEECAKSDQYHGVGSSPGLLLLDVHLPKASGFDVLRWVRDTEAWHALPVVMLTGVEVEAEAKLAEIMGANGYEVKPFGFDQLVKLTEKLRARLLEPKAALVHAGSSR
jgi:DNA-binding response OmpR family regulator